jgi:osmotically-inducible protein OsmY
MARDFVSCCRFARHNRRGGFSNIAAAATGMTMTQTGTARGAESDRGDQEAGLGLQALGALVMLLPMLLGLSGPAAAANFTPDLRHTILARAVLVKDDRIRSLNLGVKVHNRVVTLWGSVPTRELARRAEDLLRNLPDFVAVRNELLIEGDDVLLTPAARPAVVPQVWIPSAESGSGGELPVIGTIAVTPTLSVAAKSTPLCVRRLFLSPGFLTTTASLPAPPGASSAESVQPAHILSIAPEASPPGDRTFEENIRAIQQGKDSFRRIEVVVRERTVTLRGPANDPATHELARLVARLPGIERVILREQ